MFYFNDAVNSSKQDIFDSYILFLQDKNWKTHLPTTPSTTIINQQPFNGYAQMELHVQSLTLDHPFQCNFCLLQNHKIIHNYSKLNRNASLIFCIVWEKMCPLCILTTFLGNNTPQRNEMSDRIFGRKFAGSRIVKSCAADCSKFPFNHKL